MFFLSSGSTEWHFPAQLTPGIAWRHFLGGGLAPNENQSLNGEALKGIDSLGKAAYIFLQLCTGDWKTTLSPRKPHLVVDA